MIKTSYYRLLRFFLFLLPAECSHHVSLYLLKLSVSPRRITRYRRKMCYHRHGKTLWGLHFPNPVGLAAGLDKNADYVDALFGLGFGFLEVGAVTPQAQPGNTKPRLFRLPHRQALINQMGFNNKGVSYLCRRLEQREVEGLVGINIGKNKTTPLQHAKQDYSYCLQQVYPYADFITINISSPNTPELRQLQTSDYLSDLLTALKQKQRELQQQFSRYVPLLVKIAPDLTMAQLKELLAIVVDHGIDGIVSVNTTYKRLAVSSSQHAHQSGGLSGKPLWRDNLKFLAEIKKITQGNMPVIAVGGIDSAQCVQQLLEEGADLLELYTGLIYKGPNLAWEILEKL